MCRNSNSVYLLQDGRETEDPRACPPALTWEEIVIHSFRLRQPIENVPVRSNLRQICKLAAADFVPTSLKLNNALQ